MYEVKGGYGVILTQRGKDYIDTSLIKAFGDKAIHEKIIAQAINEMIIFIEKQETLIKEFEATLPKNYTFNDVLHMRTSSTENGKNSIIFDDKTLKNLGKTTEEKIENYNKAVSNLQSKAQEYYSQVSFLAKKFTRILSGNSTKKKVLEELSKEIDKLSGIEAETMSLLRNYVESGKPVQKIREEFRDLSNAMKKNPPIQITKNPDGSISCKNSNKSITNALDTLLKSLEQWEKENPDKKGKIKNLVHVTTSSVTNAEDNKKALTAALSFRKAYDILIDKYSDRLSGEKEVGEYEKQKVRDAIWALLGQWIENPNSDSYIFYADTSKGDIQRKIASAHEIVLTETSKRRVQEILPEMIIDAQHTGSNASRVIQVGVEVKNIEKNYNTHKDSKTFRFLEEQRKAKTLKEIKTMNVQDKVDDFLTFGQKDSEDSYVLAFSDKLYNAYSEGKSQGLKSLSIIGDGAANLLSSLDLIFEASDEYSFSKEIKDQLVFTLLNMSSVSILASEARESIENIQNFVKQLLVASFSQIAFNTSNFIKTLENMGYTSKKVIYLTQANNIISPLSTTLKGLVQQLQGNSIEELVSVVISPSSAYSAKALLKSAVLHEGAGAENGPARWNYVASQVASNTKLSVAMNILALSQYFNF